MNKILINLIFLIIFIIFSSGSLQINEIKDEEIFPHQLYPIDSMSVVCRFYILINVVSDQEGEPIFSYKKPTQIIIDETKLEISNSTVSFYLLNFFYVGYGLNLITVTTTLNTDIANYDLTLVCEEPKFSDFSVKVLGNFTNKFGTGEKVIFTKLVNSKYPIEVSSAGTINEHAYFKSFLNIYSNVFEMTLTPYQKLLPVIFDKTWNDSIPFSSENIVQFNIDSIYYYSGNSTPITTIFYPSILSNVIQQMGQDYSPVIEFTLDSKLVNPFNVIVGPSNFENVPRLISSENGINRYSTFFNTTGGSYIFYKKLNNETFSSISTLSTSNILPGPFLSTVSEYGSYVMVTNYSMYHIRTSTSSTYNFQSINIQYKSRNTFITAPFGFGNGSNLEWFLDLAFISTLKSRLATATVSVFPVGNPIGPTYTLTPEAVTSTPTVINSLEAIKLDGSNYLFRIQFKDFNGFNYIQFSSFYNKYYGKENLAAGTIYEGTLEFIFDIYSYDPSNNYLFLIANDVDSYQNFEYGYPYSISKPSSLLKIKYFNDYINIESIKDVSFYLNNYKVTSRTANRMYFNISDDSFDINRPMAFQLNVQKNLNGNSIDPNQYYPIKWNSRLKLFQVDFFMQPNQVLSSSYLPYVIIINYNQIIYSESLSKEYQLRVNSNKLDLKAPFFEIVQKNPINMNADIGWSVKISDSINQFSHGTIIVNAELDGSIFEFNLVASSSNPNNIFEISLNISEISAAQDYIITNVTLYDTELNESHFSYYKSATDYRNNVDPTRNPFINYLSDPKINRITFTPLQPTVDTTPPELLYFTASRNSVDVGSLDRDIEFNFAAVDQEYGLRNDQSPIVYIMDRNLEIFQFKSSIVSLNSTIAVYKCLVTVPLGFSPSTSFLVSVFGFVNNGGYYSGFSSFSLQKLGQVYNIDTTFNMDLPIITGSNKFTTYGGDLFIYGKGLGLIKKAEITFQLDNGSKQTFDVTSNVTINYNRALLISNIASTLNPISVKLYKTGSESNIYTITPIHFGIPDPEPLPTNPPQECLNNCGGSSRGTCTDSGCLCKSPYIGNDCSGEIIIVPQPSINQTNPTVEIPIYGNSSDSLSSSSSQSVENIVFKSFITLVSLREIDMYDNVVRNYTFDQWIYTNINETTNQYYTTIKRGQDLVTEITTTIQFYNQTTNVIFADSVLVMNPSSIKYTIEIGEYSFISSLNSLEFVMNAKFESSKTNDICSSKDFGNTTSGDNSNYLNIQIENHSLYGRFIKRGIIDEKVIAVGNRLLDSSLNSIGETSNQVQSFIGIIIPHYIEKAIIDPDFSVLINSNSASSKSSNSICTNSNQGLSGAKLAGIIIGCIAFASIIIIGVVYHIIKKKNEKEFLSNINMKLQNNK